MALLFDIITEIPTDIYQSTKNVQQNQITETNTTILAPNYSPQYSIAHNPILQFNSPSGSIGGSPTTQTPAVSPNITTSPNITPQLGASLSDTADLGDTLGGGGSGMMDLLLLGALIVGAVVIIPMWLKRKKKKKTKD